jgi:hypothetical protein
LLYVGICPAFLGRLGGVILGVDRHSIGWVILIKIGCPFLIKVMGRVSSESVVGFACMGISLGRGARLGCRGRGMRGHFAIGLVSYSLHAIEKCLVPTVVVRINRSVYEKDDRPF